MLLLIRRMPLLKRVLDKTLKDGCEKRPRLNYDKWILGKGITHGRSTAKEEDGPKSRPMGEKDMPEEIILPCHVMLDYVILC